MEGKDTSLLCNYTPALRGPVAFRRDTAMSELGEDNPHSSMGRRMFSDENKHPHGENSSPMQDVDGSSTRVIDGL